ncbi:protein anoxia up-regulated-like isoform X2 [Orussus abietinus]|uniref:protein anoxia up-regulated-like isoform X2 n=1 Tax=Orussus abietinus TaxID=222816 RepID=UPI000C715A9A|nr:protein anoxia up-regulated-like isoform X2 [Orussus abietinus]
MVYESDFYTTRRPYSRPLASSYTITTPRHYVVRDYPEAGVRSAQEQYSYAYTNTSSASSSSADPYVRPQRSSYTQQSTYKKESGPYGSYSTERSSRTSTGGGPGGYHSSYETHTSGRLPGGTTYRHFSYRV